MMNAWMRKHGIDIDNEAVRRILLERFAADGIVDPGPDSEEGRPTTSPWKPAKNNPNTSTNDHTGSGQLALTA